MSTDTVSKITAAAARREAAALPAPMWTTTYRLVHDAHDGLEGLIIDVFGDVAVARLRTSGWREVGAFNEVLDGLRALGLVKVKAIVDERRKHTPRELDELEAELDERCVARCMGAPLEPFEVIECGKKYEISVRDGFSQGLFLDMREPRFDLSNRWHGRRVANLFSYTCGFGVALGQSNDVTNVDVSRKYLEWGARNYELNGLNVSERGFVEEDAFAWLERMVARGERFDGIILDPPVSSRGKKGKSRPFALRKDLGTLVERCLDALSKKGELFVSTNYHGLTHDAFHRLMHGISVDWDRDEVKSWGPAADYPAPNDAYHLKTALIARPRGK